MDPSSRIARKISNNLLWQLMLGLMCWCAAGSGRMLADDLEFRAQLIWGTDEEKPKDNLKIKELDEKLREKIKKLKVFGWKNYYQIDQESFKVPEKGSKITCISQKCVIEVTHLGASVFSMEDFKSPHGFYAKLKKSSDPVSFYLRERLSESTRKELALFQPAIDHRTLNTILVEDFNKIMMGRAIYDANRFAGIKLQPETERLLKRNPQGQDLVRLNRLLLEDAYPEEVEKSHHMDGCFIEVKLYGEGKLFATARQNLPLNEFLILAGKDMEKQSNAWLVVLSRKEIRQ